MTFKLFNEIEELNYCPCCYLSRLRKKYGDLPDNHNSSSCEGPECPIKFSMVGPTKYKTKCPRFFISMMSLDYKIIIYKDRLLIYPNSYFEGIGMREFEGNEHFTLPDLKSIKSLTQKINLLLAFQ